MVKISKLFHILFLIFLFSCASNKIDNSSISQADFNEALDKYNTGKYSASREEFLSIIYNNPLSDHANDSQFYVAECDYNLGDYRQAILEYNKYLSSSYQRVPFVMKSELILCRCYYELSLEYNKDQSGTYLAIEKLQYYLEKENLKDYSSEIEDMIVSLRNKLAKKDYETAKLYIRVKEYEAAEIYFMNLINEYYDTDYFDVSVFDVSLMKSIKNKNDGLLFLEDNKEAFINKDNYIEAINTINSLNENEKVDYYIKLIK